ncbi:MAG: Glu-tRNA(Gln) amidotransferase subunit GatD [Candidatus Lokiarchaeota archaeon]|nr:Glu-tRNA(Gln) amidotransferase subunit GatD [Candidatus Lokiarchaeota archaeon]MBD3339399.1 Glu-tRNA(Gln) amidotransferase subunit GatD [Candidatus Lokiarchaeota archaeon]
MSELLKGYKGKAKAFLKKNKINVWDIVKIKTDKIDYEGILLPRNEYSSPNYIEIKLENNYNVGIKASSVKHIQKVGEREAIYKIPEKKFPNNKNLPDLKLLGTGGTVASRLDYTTGAVIPSFTPGELYSSVPELAEICNLETEIVFEILSENMRPEYWQQLAKKIEAAVNSGKQGIIIGHGTDTMGFTAAALSFMLKDLSVPVVLVGSQRSSDRPSSDAALNLINSAVVASSDIAEVVVCMLGSSDHDYGLVHRGTLVRKMHSSVRNTFRTIDDIPLGMVKNRKTTLFHSDYRKRSEQETKAYSDFEAKVALIYSYPGMKNDLIDFYVDKNYKGLVLAGTGLGHVSTEVYDSIERALQEDIIVLMTTQTLHGFVGMNVYSTGRELLNLGVVPGNNMLPEVGYVKLGWLLGQFDDQNEIIRLLQTNLVGEIIDREIPIAFNYNMDDLLEKGNLDKLDL